MTDWLNLPVPRISQKRQKKWVILVNCTAWRIRKIHIHGIRQGCFWRTEKRIKDWTSFLPDRKTVKIYAGWETDETERFQKGRCTDYSRMAPIGGRYNHLIRRNFSCLLCFQRSVISFFGLDYSLFGHFQWPSDHICFINRRWKMHVLRIFSCRFSFWSIYINCLWRRLCFGIWNSVAKNWWDRRRKRQASMNLDVEAE